MKQQLKSLLGSLIFRAGLHRRFLSSRAVIVLFHRVDDRYPKDHISCSRATFIAHCEFYKRYFVVVSLSELLAKLARGEDISRHLAITFDDGYRDNLRIAAPELSRLGLPATFFIATEFIGSTRVPWWDEEVGIASEWMTWDEVRELRDQGFELGAHTKNHVDLGVVGGQEAEDEIVGSRDRLEEETGASITTFSYPYGREHQITEENRERVKAAGFSSCLAAFGGIVSPRSNPFRICRIPISQWHVSPAHFGLELLQERRDG